MATTNDASSKLLFVIHRTDWNTVTVRSTSSRNVLEMSDAVVSYDFDQKRFTVVKNRFASKPSIVEMVYYMFGFLVTSQGQWITLKDATWFHLKYINLKNGSEFKAYGKDGTPLFHY